MQRYGEAVPGWEWVRWRVGRRVRATDRLRSECGGGRRHKISKKKVNVLRHTRGRLSLLHSPAPGPVPVPRSLLPGLGRRGHGGEAVVGRGGGGPGVRRRQGIKGGLSREGQEKVELSFPGGVGLEKESMHTMCTPNKKEVSALSLTP